jgi:FkbM family methyltransferase
METVVSAAIKKIFDIGMYDGADTAYYLECGHQVVSVEANPVLVEYARARFSTQIASGQLACVHAAITADGAEVELTLSGQDLGSSSLFADRIADKRPMGTVRVPGTTLRRLCETHGRPDYLKVDIEGADRLCVLPLTSEDHPEFLSFEIGEDVEELLAHAVAIGYRRFKVINQVSFRELANHLCLTDRVALRLVHMLGYRNPEQVRRAGRFFGCGRSSGPVPWCGDGRWYSAEATVARLRAAASANRLSGWYDIHATNG